MAGRLPAALADAAPGGLSPADIASAYNLPHDANGLSNGGIGATVAIVEAGDYVNAESDLAQYRKQYGLPACTSANGCFRKVNQRNDNVLSGTIKSGLNANQCVDVYGGEGTNNKVLDLYQCIPGIWQWWRLPGDGTVRSNANPWQRLNPNGDIGMCLDTQNGATANGTPVVVNDCNRSNSQQWRYQNSTLVNTSSGRCLNAKGASSANQTPLELQDCSTAASEQWTTNFTTKYPQPAGGAVSNGSELEWSLDIDAVSAACPNCRILMVEADVFSLDSLGTAINEAVQLGAKYVSNSWGYFEDGLDQNTVQTFDTRYLDHPGVLLAFDTGDDGYNNGNSGHRGPTYPASSSKALGVGGTTLTRNSNTTRGWTESVWSGAGSGCSALENAPAWQHVPLCNGKKATADVAAVADPSNFSVYNSTADPNSPWRMLGGTSLATPLITAMYAMAGVPGANDNPASYPYAHTSQLFDITTGSNGNCGAPLCTATAGWDGPTGLGTPNGLAAFSPATSKIGPVTSGYSGYCADVSGGNSAEGTSIIVKKCNGGTSQQWIVSADGTLRILGKCMDAQGAATADGTHVVLSTCTGSSSQRWVPDPQTHTLRNTNSPVGHGCLDITGNVIADGTQLELWYCYGVTNQQWTLPS